MAGRGERDLVSFCNMLRRAHRILFYADIILGVPGSLRMFPVKNASTKS